MTKNLIVIVGPTAIGKTALAIKLAQHFQTEIVSADSRQFFREMNIGTAKPTDEELLAVKHHLINSHSIQEEYNAGRFEQDALTCIHEIFSTHDTAILCGGSGLYVDLVCKGSDELPPKDTQIRDDLMTAYKNFGIERLQNLLNALDPLYYSQVDLKNPHRLIRAIEVCIRTGKSYSELRLKKKILRPFNIIKIGLEDEREKVYQRINARVDEMMKGGLLEEASALYHYKYLNALQTVGYTELFDYIDKKTSLERAVELIKQHTRNYAKRQWTWFRKDQEIRWFKPEEYEAIVKYLSEHT